MLDTDGAAGASGDVRDQLQSFLRHKFAHAESESNPGPGVLAFPGRYTPHSRREAGGRGFPSLVGVQGLGFRVQGLGLRV